MSETEIPVQKEYGVVANVMEPDRVLRNGAKVWIMHGWGGGGWERLKVRGLSRGGRTVTKWVPIERLSNFRRAWMPENLRDSGYFLFEPEEATTVAKNLQTIGRSRKTSCG